MVDIIEQIIHIFEKTKGNRDYWNGNIPNSMPKIDIDLNNVIEEYYSLSEKEKEAIRNDFSNDLAWLLLTFSIDMATYSLRLSEQKYFINGLIALKIAYYILDQREIMVVLALFYDVSKKRKLSFEKILKIDDKFSDFIKKFLDRKERDKSLKSMGYKLLKDKNNNLIYKKLW